MAGRHHRRVPAGLFHADGCGALRQRHPGRAGVAALVRPRARDALPGAGLLHRRCHRGVHQPGRGNEIPRPRRPQDRRLWGGFGLTAINLVKSTLF